MKKTIAIIAITAAITSICWSIATGMRFGVEKLWLISAVKAPGRMALDEIVTDLQRGDVAAATTKLQILRSEWDRFEKEDGPSGAGIGNIMLQFSRATAPETEQ
jgi:hypothetical protein